MDRSGRIVKFLFQAAFLVFLTLPAATASPTLTLDPVPEKIAEDGTVTLSVRLEWPQAEGPYELSPTEPLLENLKISAQVQSQETGILVRQTFTYELRPQGRGKARVLPFTVNYRRSEAATWTPLPVPEQNFVVVPAPPRKTLWAVSGFLVLLMTAWGIVCFRKRISMRRETAPASFPQDPKQRLYAKAQEALAIFPSQDPKERLSHCALQLRRVVGAYYDLAADTATESEFLARLKTRNLPRGEWAEVSGLFEQLEQMRFSRQIPGAYELERMQKTLLQYVQGKIIMGNPR